MSRLTVEQKAELLQKAFSSLSTPQDIFFAIDGSSSVQPHQWETMKFCIRFLFFTIRPSQISVDTMSKSSKKKKEDKLGMEKSINQSKPIFFRLFDSMKGMFFGKSQPDIRMALNDLWWKKFRSIAAPHVSDESRQLWKHIIEQIFDNQEEGWKSLGEMLNTVIRTEKLKTRAYDRLNDAKKLMNEKIAATTELSLKLSSLETEVDRLKFSIFYDVPSNVERLPDEVENIEKMKLQIKIDLEKENLALQVQDEQNRIKQDENLVASELQRIKMAKVIVLLRGPESVCQSFATKFLQDIPFIEVHLYFSGELPTDVNTPFIILNFYEVKVNIKDSIMKDPDYIQIYSLCNHCLIVRLHEYESYSSEFNNDDYDDYVPSSIFGVHTVLKLQYFPTETSVQLFDTSNQFSKMKYNDPTNEDKRKNFLFLLQSLSQLCSDRLSALQGIRDSFESPVHNL